MPADQSVPLNLAAVQERLRHATGRTYWRSLEELSLDPQFTELLHREFPRQASEWPETDAVGRRDFLKLMAASLALGGLTAGCARKPQETILPYVRSPEGMTLGKPLYFASAMPLGASAIGLLVESHEGRPTKIEGNPNHPGSLGATDVFAQAAVLELYDPDRSQVLTHLGDIRAWSAFLAESRMTTESLKSNRGAGFRILTGSVISPTLGDQLKSLVGQFPEAKWHQWDPAGSDGAREGSKVALGRALNTLYRVEQADVILSLDADFLASGPGGLRYAREFALRRKPDAPSGMNRLYVAEPTPSVTGAAADHRLPICSRDIADLAALIYKRISAVQGSSTKVDGGEEKSRWAWAVAEDLQRHRGKSVVIAGQQQPAAVHALAHAINQILGNSGSTVLYTEPVEAEPVNQLESLRELVSDMQAGKVNLLLILGGNPVYTAPADFQFAEQLKKVPTRIHLSLFDDETSQLCHWHIPEAHFLESWSDARAYDGTASIIQPLIAPLYHGKTSHEVLGAFSDKPARTSYEIVRDYWKSHTPGGDFEKFWRKSLHDGVIAGTAFAPVNVSARAIQPSQAAVTGPQEKTASQFEVVFRPDPTIYDGRFANNGWLQETPKPVTKLTWDNAAMVSPATAQKIGLGQRVAATGGEHGQTVADVVEVEVNGSKVSAAAWILPGQAEDVITLHLGYGRWRPGHVGAQKGFNAYSVRASSGLWSAPGARLRKTGAQYPLACTQAHYNIESDRNLIRGTTLEGFREDSNFKDEDEPPKSLSLYKEYQYAGYAWGMAIDLNTCIGCNSCVVACQSENNIPVVGKEQVLRGREMHWIRIDRYFEGGLNNPDTYFQPVPCMQCENAPCEEVCPVGATVHSAEGLNDMVYNRCIGTRYCSNNCPYKVRRFNFLRFADWETPSLKLLRNPEVSVRSRGVMEKCTYCVQRINAGRIEAEKQNRVIRDGEIVTACQASCPTEAIIFGNANDPNSRVAKLKAESRNYSILADLNTRPRTTYLASVRNPNPRLATPEKGTVKK